MLSNALLTILYSLWESQWLKQFILYLLVRDPVVHTRPCDPSPCGANAACREQNGAGSCSCIENHFGDPYVGCRPECIMNSDCSSNKACVRNKCIDPCPGTCASNAECKVLVHIPQCYCIPGYTGDPFNHCFIQINERKHLFIIIIKCFSL